MFGLLLDETLTVESVVTRDMLPPTPDSGIIDKVRGFPVPARTNPRGVEHKTLGRTESTDGPPPRVGAVTVGDASVLDKVTTATLTVLTGASAGKQFAISVDDRKLFSGMCTGALPRTSWSPVTRSASTSARDRVQARLALRLRFRDVVRDRPGHWPPGPASGVCAGRRVAARRAAGPPRAADGLGA